MDENDLLEAWEGWADKIVNNPLLSYIIWSNKELTDEYVRLKQS